MRFPLTDTARILGAMMRTGCELRNEWRAILRDRLASTLHDASLLPHEQLNTAHAMAEAARCDQLKAQERMSAIEARLTALEKKNNP